MRRTRSFLLAGLMLAAAGSAQAGNANFYLLHGLSDGTTRFVKMRSHLEETKAYKVDNNSYQSTAQTIKQQADQLNTEVIGNQPYVMIGQSQGGLRARYFAQYLANDSGKLGNLKGLVTIGTPNAGAPVINNAPAFMGRLDYDIFVGGIGALNTLAGLVTGTSLVRDIPQLAYLTSTGARDLDPSGDFIATINNTKTMQANCQWVESGWWIFTSWDLVCDTVPDAGNRAIPASVTTMSIVGTDNSIFDLYPEVGTWQPAAIAGGAILSASWAALLPVTLGFSAVPLQASLDFTGIAINIGSIWQGEVVGSYEGDAIVPKTSQNIYSANPNIGGKGQYYNEVSAVHISRDYSNDEANVSRTFEYIDRFNNDIEVSK
jgi:pimeloyl-ACP methyl ester carboxylesterase